MSKKTIDLLTMGCSKNLVDSEKALYRLQAMGYKVYHDPKRLHGGTAIVNTCGFIGDAKEESINTILELCEAKAQGRLERVLVTGCLSERFWGELHGEIPQVDRYYGKFDYDRMLRDLGEATAPTWQGDRLLTTPKHYAYLKISEGCDRQCAYCAIPIATGRHKSIPQEDIIREAEGLVSLGVKELQVIAQELTYYGLDLYHERRIAQLTEQLANLRGVEWVRLHYAYPDAFPEDLLRVMREQPKVCKYLDIALQHISDPVLKNMRRNTTKQYQMDLIQRLRNEVPGIALRTTLMVGYPGEGEEEFEELLEFVKWARFERMGAFAYSEEEGTWAAQNLPDQVSDEVKQARLDRLMRVQQRISAELCAQRIGQRLRVMVDRKEGDYYIGRTEWDSPEVDGEVLIKSGGRTLRSGAMHWVRVTDSDEFDLYADLDD